ncbi:MAG: ATP-grasp domain-containing protein [Ignavibacteriales bacterium]|nr:ATP-grasp domain-containing protein [Ignavibacteriales bacterium]
MRVALVYNQKKEEAVQQSMTDNDSEPPSSRGSFSPNQSLSQISNPNSHSSQVSDLYAEWDTFETIDAVRAALAEHHSVTMIEADEDAFSKLQTERPQIVFNIAEGLHGVSREAQIPAMLEMLGIPYSGSDPLTLAVCLDKSRAKEILSYYNIPTAKFGVIHSKEEIKNLNISFPNIVKPLHEGSSKGIYNSSIVHSKEELVIEVGKTLDKYNQPVLVEEFLPGREFTVAMLGNGKELHVLPIVEIIFDTLPKGVNPIYSFEAKWIWDQSDSPLDIFSCPAKIPDKLKLEIEETCRKAYTVLRCRDWCRIDVRLDSAGIPNIIELNPLPGILPKPEDNSCFPKAARAGGLSYNQLIQTVLILAAQRNGLIEHTSLHSN